MADSSPARITGQLEKILNDPLFSRSQRLSGFLRFVVQAALAGSSADLKEYTIGVEVFERSADYEPQGDPIVRITAGRLRAKLAEYYLGAGAADPILIELPRGGYAPQFTARGSAPASFPRVRRESVGRETEMAQLRNTWLGLTSTGGRMVTVSGDAGMGKTTFAEDFLAGVEDSGVVIARGRCSERLAETDAFAPVLDALDGLARAGGDAARVLESTAPAWYAQVTTAQSKPPSHERMRREFAALFVELALLRPVILFLDDLHWADASTCDLLAYLGQRMRDAAVLVIATYRPGAVLAAGHPFLPLKLRLEGWGICHEIPLSLLTRDNVRLYLANTFPGNRFPEELAAILHERTEGYPLFLTDLLRYLVDTGVLAEQDGVWDLFRSAAEVRRVIPAGTHAMISVKLAELGEADREILRCAAVQGVQFDSAVVARVLSMDPVFVEDRLRELDSIHRLVSEAEELGKPGPPRSLRYRFVHVFYQNALYVSMTPSRRAAHSLAVAQVLSGLGGETSRPPAAELAVLYESGRDHSNAAQCFLQAARNAARVFAYPEAVLLCERGLKALATLPESRWKDEQELVFSLTLGMAMMSTKGYAAPQVEKTYRRAQELCLKLNEVRRLVPVLWAIHTCVTNAGKLPESLEVALAMRRTADSLGQKEAIVESLHSLGTTLAFMGRLSEARQTLERIFEIAPVAQHEFRGSLYVIDPLVTSLSMLARLVTLMGDFDSGRRMANQALELAQRLSHPHSLVYARFWIGWILQTGGDHEQAVPHLEAAMEMGRTHDLPLIVEWGRVVRGAALAQLGRREEGIAEMRKSIEQQEAMGAQLGRPYCLTLLAEALLAQGDAAQALVLCNQALDLASRTQSLDFQPETHRLRAEALSALGHPESAVRMEFDTALRLAHGSGCLLLQRRIERRIESSCPASIQNGMGGAGLR